MGLGVRAPRPHGRRRRPVPSAPYSPHSSPRSVACAKTPGSSGSARVRRRPCRSGPARGGAGPELQSRRGRIRRRGTGTSSPSRRRKIEAPSRGRVLWSRGVAFSLPRPPSGQVATTKLWQATCRDSLANCQSSPKNCRQAAAEQLQAAVEELKDAVEKLQDVLDLFQAAVELLNR